MITSIVLLFASWHLLVTACIQLKTHNRPLCLMCLEYPGVSEETLEVWAELCFLPQMRLLCPKYLLVDY